jgi:hypothetical protein
MYPLVEKKKKKMGEGGGLKADIWSDNTFYLIDRKH